MGEKRILYNQLAKLRHPSVLLSKHLLTQMMGDDKMLNFWVLLLEITHIQWWWRDEKGWTKGRIRIRTKQPWTLMVGLHFRRGFEDKLMIELLSIILHRRNGGWEMVGRGDWGWRWLIMVSERVLELSSAQPLPQWFLSSRRLLTKWLKIYLIFYERGWLVDSRGFGQALQSSMIGLHNSGNLY